MRQTLARVLDDFGRRLAELRRARGWTQSRAAVESGMPEKDYQAIENGRRAITIRTALALAQTFDQPLRALFDPPASLAPRRPGRPSAATDRNQAIERQATEPSAPAKLYPPARGSPMQRVADGRGERKSRRRK